MPGKEHIGTRQAAILVVYFAVGDMLLFLPSSMSSIVRQDAWISALIGLPIGIGLAWYIYWYSEKFPGRNLIGIHTLVLGRWLGGIVSLLYLGAFFNNSVVTIREIGDFVTTQMMTETPMRVICLLMIILSVIVIRSGLENIARSAEFFFPLYLLMLTTMVIFLLPEAHIAKLTPVMENGFQTLAEGVVYYVTFPFAEMFVFWMIFPHILKNKHLKRDYLLGVTIAGVIIFAMILMSLLVLGPYLTKHQMYSTYTLAKKVNIGHFVQRLEAIMALTWIMSTFMRSIIYGYAFIKGVSDLLKLRDYRPLTIPLGVTMFGYAVIVSPHVVYMNAINPYWILWDLTYVPVISILVFLIYRIKLRWGRGSSPSK
ncbi:endospore germination permease [Paenibacillus filicis]|uniref:Endospore germination permease n=1 Tax=Paenibacillus filicis TaxID=669464 RepID=A0ABU9DWP2_9BACL